GHEEPVLHAKVIGQLTRQRFHGDAETAAASRDVPVEIERLEPIAEVPEFPPEIAHVLAEVTVNRYIPSPYVVVAGRRDIDVAAAAVADDCGFDGAARRRLVDEPRKLTGAAHALAVELDHNVSAFEPGLFSRGAWTDVVNLHAGCLVPAGLSQRNVAERHSEGSTSAGQKRQVARPPPKLVLPLPVNERSPDNRDDGDARDNDEYGQSLQQVHRSAP